MNSFTGNVGTMLIACHKEMIVFTGNIFAVVMMIAIGMWSIPTYGAIGAAIAVTAGLFIRNLVAAMGAWKSLGIIASPFGKMRPTSAIG